MQADGFHPAPAPPGLADRRSFSDAGKHLPRADIQIEVVEKHERKNIRDPVLLHRDRGRRAALRFGARVQAGALAGLAGGLVCAWALTSQGQTAEWAVLFGSSGRAEMLAVHLGLSVSLGVAYGSIFGAEQSAEAASLSTGIVFGLLWWMIGPLTLLPILVGQEPLWSVSGIAELFHGLVGALVFGAVTGLAFHFLGCRMAARRQGAGAEQEDSAVPQRRILIVGGGFAGIGAAHRLERLLAGDDSVEVLLVSQSNFLLFTPLLAQVASGGLQPEHVSAPIRAALTRSRFLRGTVTGVDLEGQTALIQTGRSSEAKRVHYDHLILAVGSVPYFSGVPGVREHAFTLKTLDDASGLRSHVINMLEQADTESATERRQSLLTFVVAGGGFAGTEVIAELFDLAHSVLFYYPGIDRSELCFVLVHSRSRILPELDWDLADFALRKLRERGIEVVLGERIVEAGASSVRLSSGGSIATRTLIWTAGNRPHPLIEQLPLPRGRRGTVATAPTLQVEPQSNVWAVGDCASVPHPFLRGTWYAPTAQNATRASKTVAANVAAALAGRPLKQFRHRSLGTLVGLGHRTALAQLRGWKFSGALAWFLRRTVYLMKLPGSEKKLRVSLDWTIDLFFPRDIVQTRYQPPEVAFENRDKSLLSVK